MTRLLSVLFLMWPLHVSAEPASCEQYADLAAVIMKSRQMGVDMAHMFTLSKGDALVESIVITAFEHPRFELEENRAKAVQEFKNTIFLICTKQERTI